MQVDTIALSQDQQLIGLAQVHNFKAKNVSLKIVFFFNLQLNLTDETLKVATTLFLVFLKEKTSFSLSAVARLIRKTCDKGVGFGRRGTFLNLENSLKKVFSTVNLGQDLATARSLLTISKGLKDSLERAPCQFHSMQHLQDKILYL